MNLIHLSERKNRNSILSKGLIPTTIKLEHHLDYFNRYGMISGNKAVYTWLDSEKNEKFLKDMVYCKAWIHPRNDLVDSINLEDGIYRDNFDFRKIGIEPLIQEDKIFDVFLINKEDKYSGIFHGQEPQENPYNSCYNMDEKYAHDDKILHVYDKPVMVSKIIGQVAYYYDNSKINIKVLN